MLQPRFSCRLALALSVATAAPPAVAAQGPYAGRPAAARPATLARALHDTLREVLDAAVREHAFPGAYAVIGDHTGILASYGAQSRWHR